jgi:GT2 family glycosyltransferase
MNTSSTPHVLVVILNYNRCEDTLAALISLAGMTYPNFDLLVVDDHSTDGTAQAVKDRFPHVGVLVQPENLGFAAGANAGLRQAVDKKVDLVLLINNDVQVAPDMLSKLVDAMEPKVGAAAPFIYYQDHPGRIWSAGFSRHPLLLEPRRGMRGQLDTGERSELYQVDYLLGCAMLIKVTALEEIGLFDERFFFYYEDLDLSLRLQRKGYRLLIVPQAKMWHKVALSAPLGSAFRTYHMARSSGIFFRTHAKGLRLLPVFFFRFGSALKNSLKYLAGGRSDLLRAYWKGVWAGWLKP